MSSTTQPGSPFSRRSLYCLGLENEMQQNVARNAFSSLHLTLAQTLAHLKTV
jgi:hypothetical protein